ncbi:MAG: ribosome silencing factor [Ruminococcus sp.]|jgi:ribosome-associated protein|nr:ribosome silencing factor [Ruminococcus sp.]
MAQLTEDLITAVKVLDAKKAIDLRLLDISEQSSLADFFLIASGTSSTHTGSLADEVEFKLKERGLYPKNIQADKGKAWIILDYIDFIIHIFDKETREFYSLERLWRDGADIDLTEITTVD